MKPIKHLIITSILAASLAGCTTYQHDQSRRSKIAQFIINHPVAARTIGVEDYKSVNISSNAARLAKRTGLDNKANGEGRGTQVNAVRHTLWQAAISSQFDSIIAERAGDAYLSDTEVREGKTDYFSRLAADQAVDIRNNRIGRSIGSGKPQADMKTLAQAVLFSQNKLSDAEYRRALNNLEVLNSDGMTPFEERLYNPSKLREIKKSVEAIGNVQD